MASDLEHNASLLALISSSSRETTHLHRGGGLNLPNILYVYHSSHLKTYIKWPHSLMMPNAGLWSSYQTLWSASMPELVQQFTTLGFETTLVTRELKRLEHRRLPQDLLLSSERGAGFLAAHLLFRLWDAAGLNCLVDSQREYTIRLPYQVPPSEFEVSDMKSASIKLNASSVLIRRYLIHHQVYSASSNFSADTDQTEDTVLGVTPPPSPPHPSTSTLPPPVPSVIMASPSEHESAYDDVFYQSFAPPAPTVQGSDCSSESGRSEVRSRMDWTSGHSVGVPMSTSSRLSKIIRVSPPPVSHILLTRSQTSNSFTFSLLATESR